MDMRTFNIGDDVRLSHVGVFCGKVEATDDQGMVLVRFTLEDDFNALTPEWSQARWIHKSHLSKVNRGDGSSRCIK